MPAPAEVDRGEADRVAVVWCPDWPVAIWGIPADEPAATFVANRVVACTQAARDEGVQVGMRRREAQGRCPDLAVLDRDLDREVRLFEPVAQALEAVSAAVEVSEAGLAGFPTRGPSRYFGGDQALAERMVEVVESAVPPRAALRVAIADGSFAARLLAQGWGTGLDSTVRSEPPIVLDPGDSPRFLAGLPVSVLDRPDLAGLLERLGLRTLGSFAALPVGDVVGRFGRDGEEAHRLAGGGDEHPPNLRRPALDLAVSREFDPPAERIETCALAARQLADELYGNLLRQGLACVRLGIEARNHGGQEFSRFWRAGGPGAGRSGVSLDTAAVAERTRWQLDAWLQASRSDPVEHQHGVILLTLVPDEVIPARGRQLGLWGDRGRRADDVTRAVARVQTLVGVDAVRVPEWQGGRHPGEQFRLLPAAAVDLSEERVVGPPPDAAPWPDRLPEPAPARVLSDPAVVQVANVGGRPVEVSGRGELSDEPALVTLSEARGSHPVAVVAWAGPWPADERWWDPLTQQRRARLQVVLADGTAHLVAVEGGVWWLEATYD